MAVARVSSRTRASGRASLRACALLTTVAAVTLLAVPDASAAVADWSAGTTSRVSLTAAGGQTARGSSELPGAALSGDGRYVAFVSSAPDLVVGDTNGVADVFVRDRVAGTTTRVNVDESGNPFAYQPADQVALSADGRHVAYRQHDEYGCRFNGCYEIYWRDLQAPSAVRLARTCCERLGGISADGQLVVYSTLDDYSGESRVLVWRAGDRTARNVAVSGTGQLGNDRSWSGGISADGRRVVLESLASNLVPRDTNGAADVLVHDRTTGATKRASVGPSGQQANGASGTPVISGNGRYVAFQSKASNLVPGDTNAQPDVFVRDLVANTTRRVSVSRTGAQADRVSGTPALSADGRYVAFVSYATNLVPGDTNGRPDVFVRDQVTGAMHRVSLGAGGAQAAGASAGPAISPDGRHVAFSSLAANLVAGDTNRGRDLFVRHAGAA